MPAPQRFIAPMECTSVASIPEGREWQYELKLDGYRAIAVKQDGEVELFSRNGKSFNSNFKTLLAAAHIWLAFARPIFHALSFENPDKTR